MHVSSRNVVIRHGHERAPVVGFVGYVDPSAPTIMRRHGWEVGDDVHDDFYDLISHDNGRTWSEPVVSLKNFEADGGKYIHTENAMLLIPRANKIVTITNEIYQPLHARHHEMGHPSRVRMTYSAVQENLKATPFVSDFGLPGGLCISFCHPMLDSKGRVLVPVMTPSVQAEDGDLAALGIKIGANGLAADYGQARLVIGEPDGADGLKWRVTGKVPFQTADTSRGMLEPAIAELSDGRLVMICRGSNHMWPYKRGRKWVTFSHDGGETWSRVTPLTLDTGFVPESSSTGSALIRHSRTGRLYWIGNLCRAGQRAEGNYPRSPLYIAEVREEPFALVRESIMEIGDAYPDEGPLVQHSNFKVYEDRQTGEFVLYLTRYCERGSEGMDWMKADHYCFRVVV